jgi:hypothetical protein
MSEDLSDLHYAQPWGETTDAEADGHEDGVPGRLAAEVAVLRAEITDLRRALASRPTIEQAKGVLMLRFHFGPETAFAVMKRVSQDNNIKLREVAQAIVAAAQRTAAPPPYPSARAAAIATHLLDGNADGWPTDPATDTGPTEGQGPRHTEP